MDGPRARKRLSPTAWKGRGSGGELQASGMYEVNEELGPAGSYTLSALVLGTEDASNLPGAFRKLLFSPRCGMFTGEHVVGSPMTLSVCPGQPDGEHSILVPPPVAAIAHEVATFVVQVRSFHGLPPPSRGLLLPSLTFHHPRDLLLCSRATAGATRLPQRTSSRPWRSARWWRGSTGRRDPSVR